MNSNSNPDLYVRTYYPGHYWLRLTIGLLWLSFPVFGLIYSILSQKYGFVNYLELVTIPITLIYLLNSRLTMSLDGITYYYLGYSIQAHWKNVIGIEHAQKGNRQVDVLLLRESILKKTPFLGLFRFYDPITDLEKDAQSIPFGTAIPLSWFDEHWEESELGKELRQYIPGMISNRDRITL
jgi:hypothetical protein